MKLDEVTITEAIASEYFNKFTSCLNLDVALVGAGPSGMTAAWILARKGFHVAVFERNLAIGGGMWGGGMTWNVIVVQEESRQLAEEIGLPLKEYTSGYYTVDAVAATTTLASKATLSGAHIFNCLGVEDLVLRQENDQLRVTGIVINSSPVQIAGFHVDPLVINCRYLVECSGHELNVLSTLVRKNDITLATPSGTLEGENSMWADRAETDTLENTREVFPGVYVAGMAANACFGSYRMGPVFGGMLLSGQKVAHELAERLS
jgi:thiamine thiazole synthase